MARKPKKVDEVYHGKKGMRIPIYLDTDESTFSAVVFDQRIVDGNLRELKNKVWKALDAFGAYQWEQVIYVSEESHDDVTYMGRGAGHARASVAVEFWRVEVAKNPQNPEQFVERPFLSNGLTDENLMYLDKAAQRPKDEDDDYDLVAEQKERFLKENERERESGKDVKTHYDAVRGRGMARIPYSPKSWQALCLIRQRIEAAAAQLKDIVASADLAKKLELVGARMQPMLPPAEEKK